MNDPRTIDGVLVEWGERLFYPGNRRVTPAAQARLRLPLGDRAAAVRQKIRNTLCRSPQVMVKVTGGGRGMGAIAAHFRYISKRGRLQMEDDRGVIREGREAVAEVAEQWRYAGSLIPQHSERREAFNIVLSMPRGTDPQFVLRAARDFAKAELADHRYVMVLHEHQANPHVHLSVRAESRHGKRLNPRKADLHRWRETFAEKLRSYGLRADATRQVTRGDLHPQRELWQTWARDEGRLRRPLPGPEPTKGAALPKLSVEAWARMGRALAESAAPEDRELAQAITRYFYRMPAAIAWLRAQPANRQRELVGMERTRQVVERTRPGPEMER
ncbi:MAG: relaxase/mobilization nuclease domain-containing protein [Burkholderiaceae bacterium]|nr:MAG: relaxase/mobilization nuclease domain-containing protein [Burkholderiaceae bacterium]MBE7427123.1 relaxase/mobilization nuclease domain-containing protein [Ideonella sp.]MCC7285960.1 relaxase/mobilization nuclease domain-containing protein [Burkholderiaceae bacterium]